LNKNNRAEHPQSSSGLNTYTIAMVALTAAVLQSTASSHLAVQLSLKTFIKLKSHYFGCYWCKSALNWLSWRGQMTDVEKVSVCRVQAGCSVKP